MTRVRKVEERLWKRAQSKATIAVLRSQERKEREIRKEMKECTFTPNIKYHVPQTKVSVVAMSTLLRSCGWLTDPGRHCGTGKVSGAETECTENERGAKAARRGDLQFEIKGWTFQIHNSSAIQTIRSSTTKHAAGVDSET